MNKDLQHRSNEYITQNKIKLEQRYFGHKISQWILAQKESQFTPQTVSCWDKGNITCRGRPHWYRGTKKTKNNLFRKLEGLYDQWREDIVG